MSPGQTGHITGQMGRVPGTDGTHTRGCPAKILYVYWFFSFPISRRLCRRLPARKGPGNLTRSFLCVVQQGLGISLGAGQRAELARRMMEIDIQEGMHGAQPPLEVRLLLPALHCPENLFG